MKKIVYTLIGCLCVHLAQAQSDDSSRSDYVYPQKVTPTELANYSFSGYYYNGKRAYNLRQAPLCSAGGTIASLKINPAGSSFALLYAKGKIPQVAVYDLWKSDRLLYELPADYIPTAICYAPDAKTLAVAGADKALHLYDSRSHAPKAEFGIAFAAERLAISPNNYFAAASRDDILQIWNLETRQLRKELALGAKINAFVFSADNASLGVLTADGVLTLYDTRTFLPMQEFDAMGAARSCDIHAEGKYLAVVSGDNRIALINKMDNTDRRYIDNADGGITDVRFVKDGKGRCYLLYNTARAIVYTLIEDLSPYYTQLLSDELNEKMNVWMKQMDGESLEEYHARVNDESRMRQMALFEQEIATRMADNLLSCSEVSLGNFNPETNTLAIDFNTMPSIYLNMPADKIGSFMDTEALEFRNALYGLTKDDKFELVYVDVYNRKTGETYTFDNRARKSLDYLKSDDSFVPLELVQLSNMDEMKLREIKDDIVTRAKAENRITNHTQIAVNAGVVSSVDASGEKILNYRIGFSYNVEKGFSAREDFAPGKYLTEQSGAAASMLSIIKTAFEHEFAQYVRPGKKVRIVLTGMADRLPVNGRIAYDGAYGDYKDEPVYGEELYALTVTRESGITQNDQLAFLRAAGVKNYLERHLESLATMDTEYEYRIQLADKTGGEYRRISVDFTFIDAF